jgi:hypothetical protein
MRLFSALLCVLVLGCAVLLSDSRRLRPSVPGGEDHPQHGAAATDAGPVAASSAEEAIADSPAAAPGPHDHEKDADEPSPEAMDDQQSGGEPHVKHPAPAVVHPSPSTEDDTEGGRGIEKPAPSVHPVRLVSWQPHMLGTPNGTALSYTGGGAHRW